MNVLTRYIVREILKSAFVSQLLLLALFNLFTLSDELDDIGKGDYGLTEVFYFLALTSPTVFYELMPASALLGSLFALGNMGNFRELIAMRAAGLSVFGIIRSVMIGGILLATVAVLVGEFIAPSAEEKAQLIKVTSQNRQVMLKTRYGLWLREERKFINVRQVEENGDLADISIYEIDGEQHLRRSTHAGRAEFLGGQQWRLHDVKQSDISPENMHSRTDNERIWASSIEPDLLKIVVVNPDNLSIYDLAMYVNFLKENQQKSHNFEMAFWGRVVNPLVIFVMLLVSTPLVIGVRRGISVGARILIGAIIGMGFNVFDITIGHIGLIYNLNPPLMAFIPSLTVLTITLIAIKRTQ